MATMSGRKYGSIPGYARLGMFACGSLKIQDSEQKVTLQFHILSDPMCLLGQMISISQTGKFGGALNEWQTFSMKTPALALPPDESMLVPTNSFSTWMEIG